jgi:asparagine synthase (glutamine-hydrolysing)
MKPPSNIDRVAAQPKPWFGVRIAGGAVRAEGTPACTLGKRIPVAGRPLDEGVFVDWKWDGRTLTVANDRYGLYPLFYCAKADSIWISPSLEQVVRGNSTRELDRPALGIFHRLGHFIGEDTPFADVRFLPPDTTLTWQEGRLELRPRANTVGQAAARQGNFDDAVDTYCDLFARSIARRLPEDDRFTVPISGGRDSRHVLLELARQGCRPRWCATVKYRPPATNEDTRIARILTARLGIEHVELDKPPSFFQAALKDVHLTNHCGGGHGWVLPLASRLAGEVGTTYDGLAGEVLSGGFMLSQRKDEMFRQGDFDTLARLVLQENGNEGALCHVLADDLYRSLPLDEAVKRLVPELRRHAGLPNPVLSFVFGNRTRRCVASIPFAILHQVPLVHVPFLDHELFDFLSALDPSVVADNRLHDATIRRAYPDFADVPYEDKSVRAAFTPAEQGYYRQARRELLDYLRETPASALRVVSRRYLYTKAAADLLMRRVDPPWYLRTALQAVELERLRGGS